MTTTKREDLQLVELAKSMGYTPKACLADTSRKIPHFPLSFTGRNRVIWQSYDARFWICADYSNASQVYENHRHYKSLKEAFEKEKLID